MREMRLWLLVNVALGQLVTQGTGNVYREQSSLQDLETIERRRIVVAFNGYYNVDLPNPQDSKREWTLKNLRELKHNVCVDEGRTFPSTGPSEGRRIFTFQARTQGEEDLQFTSTKNLNPATTKLYIITVVIQ